MALLLVIIDIDNHKTSSGRTGCAVHTVNKNSFTNFLKSNWRLSTKCVAVQIVDPLIHSFLLEGIAVAEGTQHAPSRKRHPRERTPSKVETALQLYRTTMGKFLRDPRTGDPVAIDGGLVLEKTLDRKPRDCEQCGFNKWVKNDKIFMLQKSLYNNNHHHNDDSGSGSGNDSGGSGSGAIVADGAGMQVMEWICPDCALQRGLHPQFYHKNFFSEGSPEAIKHAQEAAAAADAAEHQTVGFCNAFGGWTNLFCHS